MKEYLIAETRRPHCRILIILLLLLLLHLILLIYLIIILILLLLILLILVLILIILIILLILLPLSGAAGAALPVRAESNYQSVLQTLESYLYLSREPRVPPSLAVPSAVGR
eukprot:GHVU01037600.1.p1 GENE.GHVU01037600.1~~GHVU01037600.1.p1  ORF type:complete len:112 (-),score=29.64 GHVU01037600.1:118-453(-)